MERNCLLSSAPFVKNPKSSANRIPFRNFEVHRASKGFASGEFGLIVTCIRYLMPNIPGLFADLVLLGRLGN